MLYLITLIVLASLLSGFLSLENFAYSQNATTATTGREIPGSLFAKPTDSSPIINDPKLKVQLVYEGLELPTSMAFIAQDDILVLQKAKGTVQRITNGHLISKPLLVLPVSSEVERGMLGIAVSKETNGTIYVFLYLTETLGQPATITTAGIKNDNITQSIANRLYRYELTNNKLTNPRLLLDLPATPGPRHNGGAITIGPDGNVYVPIGDLDGHTTQAQNVIDGGPPDGSGGILRITKDGVPAGNILDNNSPTNKYFAYGIRNSFGLDFDPISGKLWDSENGAGSNDEINLVEPGFNSGWTKVQGKAPLDFDYSQLENFHGKGKYHDPAFTWFDTIGPTEIRFLNSTKLGKQYEDNLFVSDIHQGRIYHFTLNETRTGLSLRGLLADKVADSSIEAQGLIFGSNFAGISDLVVGPDGYLYVLSFGSGAIYRILPVDVKGL
jgi:aldose sugar dehydrogenase